MGVKEVRAFTSLTGGGQGALDAFDGDLLEHKDIAVVVSDTAGYLYTLHASAASAESSPFTIQPDANSGDKRWILVSIFADDISQGDNTHHYLGTDGDLDIYHTGAYGGIDNDTGGLYIDGATGESIFFRNASTLAITIGSDQVTTFVKHVVGPSSDPTTDYQYANKNYCDTYFGELATAKEWTAQQNFNELAITSSSNATAWNTDTAQCAVHTLTENTTISAPSNLNAGGHYTLRVVQAAGVYTLAFNAVFKWGEATTPVAPAANGDVVIFSFYSDGTNMYGVDAVRVEA